jgi:phytoene synthase
MAVGEVLGLQHSDAPQFLEQLGAGLRLVHVMRNVDADRARGKIYIPLEDLARARYSERDLLAGAVNDRLHGLWSLEGERARLLLEEGSRAMSWIASDKSRLFVAVMIALADASLRRRPTRPNLTTAMRLRELPSAWRRLRRATR